MQQKTALTPGTYDFSTGNVTDIQYLTDVAVKNTYSEEQRIIWGDAYTYPLDRIVENADDGKAEYVAYTAGCTV